MKTVAVERVQLPEILQELPLERELILTENDIPVARILPYSEPDKVALQWKRIEALRALRALGGLSKVIPDPVSWQREQREDRFLPGRE